MPKIRKPSRRAATVAVATAALVGGGLTVAETASSHAVTSTYARVVTRSPSPLPYMTDINWASHSSSGGYDRVVWKFSGSAPGYDVRYVTTPTYCGSGGPVRMTAARFLQVTIKPATAHRFGTGTMYPYLPSVKKIKKTCDFEGHVTYVLGIDHKAGFHVSTLYSPTRIYVDVAH